MQNQTHLIFDDYEKTILLSVEREALGIDAVAEIAREKNVLLKSEFHITIVGFQARKVLRYENIDFQTVKKIAQSIDWNLIVKNEFYFFTKTYPDGEMRSSIIQIVELPGMIDFYRQLNMLVQQKFPMPFPHITLYSNSSKPENASQGIRINSAEDFQNLSPEHLL